MDIAKAIATGGAAVESINPASVRPDFPALRRTVNGHPLAFLDNAAGTLKPQSVIESMREYYSLRSANVHRGIHQLSEESTEAFEAARDRVARFINADASEVVFTRNTTEGINLVAHSYGLSRLRPGDEILCTTLEHHANLVPWQIVAQRTGATIRYARVLPSGQLDLEHWHSLLNERTRLVTLSRLSNVTGTIQPIRQLTEAAHGVGAVVMLDAAQGVPHLPTDVQELGIDFMAFNSYKLLGPFGIGALYGRYRHLKELPPYQTGGAMITSVSLEGATYADPPQRFEAGTPAVGDAIGFASALDYLAEIGMERVHNREAELSLYMHERLAEIPGLRVIGDYYPGKPSIAAFVMDYAHPHDIAQFLNDEGVAVRSGHHCAEPLHRALGATATTRASLYFYNTEDEIDQLIRALGTVREIFG